ncbi:hypothetical protein A9Q84_19110 [Halobacteriovorax marinus]|uniref:histidine kinase n=1 Tax=Halobacteriovorax marinus TaxID=97084 RepID=A0A1Y5F6A3_9BACT|nr:hypothetical protein A9Q84_19110 [Halobacteriovorax marinus]
MKINLLISHVFIIICAFLFRDPKAIAIAAIFSFVVLLIKFLKAEKMKSFKEAGIKKNQNHMVEARDKLLRSVNHELRAPLTRMKLDVEFLEDADIKKSLNEDINQMHALVNELMEIEKIKAEGIERTQVDLTVVLNELVETLNVDHDLLEIDSKNESFIEGDESKLRKLFKNLIENAYKYKSAEGRVFISVTKKTTNTIVTIMNEGSSISGDDLPFIFEPFFRVKGSDEREKKEGFGIGLNICKEIIEAHNAKIQVSSKKDHGTTFKLTF